MYTQVSTNGIITLGVAIGDESPQMFPASFWTYAVAPFWQNFNTTMGGRVVWKIIDSSNDSASVDAVNTLIKEEQGDTNFNGIWMLAASWEDTIVEGNSVSKCLQPLSLINLLSFVGQQQLPSRTYLQWDKILCYLHLLLW